jgi:lipoyl(octanoyl) transferase
MTETAATAAAAAARRLVRVRWLGRMPYAEGLRLQREAAESLLAGGDETLMLLEHEPVFTLGRNASRRDVLLSERELARRGIEVFETDRGGKVTYHGPGQLVGYPITRLDPERRDVKRYVTNLEETLIRALADVGVRAERSPLKERVTSVWVGNDKIAAIGVHVARDVTTHGFALNVTDEPMAGFAGIVPCGIVDGGVTSIERVLGSTGGGGAPSIETVGRTVVARFGDVFSREIVES